MFARSRHRLPVTAEVHGHPLGPKAVSLRREYGIAGCAGRPDVKARRRCAADGREPRSSRFDGRNGAIEPVAGLCGNRRGSGRHRDAQGQPQQIRLRRAARGLRAEGRVAGGNVVPARLWICSLDQGRRRRSARHPRRHRCPRVSGLRHQGEGDRGYRSEADRTGRQAGAQRPPDRRRHPGPHARARYISVRPPAADGRGDRGLLRTRQPAGRKGIPPRPEKRRRGRDESREASRRSFRPP